MPKKSFNLLNEIAKWAVLLSILGTLLSGFTRLGQIMQRQDDQARDIERIEQALVLTHPDTSRAFGLEGK